METIRGITVIVVLFAACATVETAVIDGEGTEEPDEGTQLSPMNLPDEPWVEGLRIEAQGRRRDDMVSTGMVGPIVELDRIRPVAGSAAGEGGAEPGTPQALWGTRWRLEDLAGRGVIDFAQTTLEFPEPGRAAGFTACNRFFGEVEAAEGSIAFGKLAATRKGCSTAVMDQEQRYLEALERAERYELAEPFLSIHCRGLEAPLRLIRLESKPSGPLE